MLDPDTTAPDFELANQDGEPVALSDFEGQRVVLFFYPKANTRGCTMEACGFRDAWDEYAGRDVVVLGISTDPVEELEAFREEYGFPYDLLSDPTGEVARRYESFQEVEHEGETFEVAQRNTYVVGPDGRVERAYEGVSPEGHAEAVLADL